MTTEEEYDYCSYCNRKKPKEELERNDGLCEECATMLDEDDIEAEDE
jgi:hypothetical protein